MLDTLRLPAVILVKILWLLHTTSALNVELFFVQTVLIVLGSHKNSVYCLACCTEIITPCNYMLYIDSGLYYGRLYIGSKAKLLAHQV